MVNRSGRSEDFCDRLWMYEIETSGLSAEMVRAEVDTCTTEEERNCFIQMDIH